MNNREDSGQFIKEIYESYALAMEHIENGRAKEAASDVGLIHSGLFRFFHFFDPSLVGEEIINKMFLHLDDFFLLADHGKIETAKCSLEDFLKFFEKMLLSIGLVKRVKLT